MCKVKYLPDFILVTRLSSIHLSHHTLRDVNFWGFKNKLSPNCDMGCPVKMNISRLFNQFPVPIQAHDPYIYDLFIKVFHVSTHAPTPSRMLGLTLAKLC